MARKTERATVPRITKPTQQILLMLIICGAVGIGGFFIWPQVEPVFLSSPYLNGAIGLVFIVGVLATFVQVSQLFSSISWIEDASRARAGDDIGPPPRLLASMTGIARVWGSRMQITGPSARSILDSVGSRMEESREITRYIANLLIFLGLLGTFFGLATTVPAVVETIRNLQPSEGEAGLAVFTRLMDGLEDQLGGMGTAFASSLLGLAGSLVVGLLELYAGHGQNRFYQGLEEWLASITRVNFSSGDAAEGGGGIDRNAISTVLDHMVDQMETLQSLFSQSEARRAETEKRVVDLAHTFKDMAQKMGPGPIKAAQRLAASQDRLSKALESSNEGAGADEESRMRLRSIDVQLLKIYEELGLERGGDLEALRTDISQLTLALQDLTRMARPSRDTRDRTPQGRLRGGRQE